MRFNLGQTTDAENRIKRDFLEFSRLWQEVKQDWSDDRSRQFERDHLTSLGPCLSRFAAQLSEFTDAVRKADRTLRDDAASDSELY